MKERAALDPAYVQHGTEVAYTKNGCRCADCVSAYAQHQQAWRAANAERVANYNRERTQVRGREVHAGEQWTGPQLDMVLRRDLSLNQLAELLGRTAVACGIARHKALHDPKWMRVVGTKEVVTMTEFDTAQDDA